MSSYTRTTRLLPVLGIIATPLCLALMGFTHPHDLTPETADYWFTLHYVLLPVFPLLGVNLWWLLADTHGPWAWLARILAFVYMPFYGALDVLAGMGTGLVVQRAYAGDQVALTAVNDWLFDQGNALAEVGVWAFLLACALTSALLIRRLGRSALPGGILLLVSAISFLNSHIYYPRGVLTMFGLTVAFGWLQWARLQVPAAASTVSNA